MNLRTLLTIFALIAGLSAAETARADWSLKGINAPNANPPIADLKDLGVTAVRVNYVHNGVILTRGTVQAYQGAGMKVLVVLDGNAVQGSKWEAAYPDLNKWRQYVGVYAMMASLIVSRLGADAYEIWNEENNSAAPIDEAHYEQLLRVTCDQIRKRGWNGMVVMGGLDGAFADYVANVRRMMGPDAWRCVNAVAFHVYENVPPERCGCVRQVGKDFICPDGCAAKFSGLATSNGKPLNPPQVQFHRDVERMSRAAGKPIMLTEYGTVHDSTQACLRDNIIDFFNTAPAAGLHSAFYFAWLFDGPGGDCGGSYSDQMSLVNRDHSHKNSWKVFQTNRR